MDKEKEIELLRKLSEADSYFADCFGADVEQMVSNINNDFPLSYDCTFSTYQEKYDRLQTEYQQFKFNLAVRIYKYTDREMPDELNGIVESLVPGVVERVRAKWVANVPPEPEEVESLLNMVKP